MKKTKNMEAPAPIASGPVPPTDGPKGFTQRTVVSIRKYPARYIGGVLLLALTLIGLVWAYERRVHDEAMHAQAGETIYYCPMHPQVTSNKPGACPICFMELVPKANSTGKEMDGYQGVMLTREAAIKSNVSTAKVGARLFSREIAVVGTVQIPERGEEVITSRVGGYIERLYANATGDQVRTGQRLFDLYSPELLNAQQEYLAALHTGFAADQPAHHSSSATLHQSLINAGRRRLELYGMTPSQIDRLEKTNDVARTTTIYATRGGVVMSKLVQEGAYINPGTPILQLADLSQVWAEIEIGQEDLQWVKPGMTAHVSAEAYPGETFTGKVIFISPVANAASRTVMARVALANPGQKLKPQMFVNALLSLIIGEGIAVPASAVIRGGKNDYVWLRASDGSFVRREVQLGIRTPEGDYQVITGVSAGDEVAVTGAFLVDSEHELSSISSMAGMDHTAGQDKKPRVTEQKQREGTAKGIVRAIDHKRALITIDHGEIPGLMGPMVMPFPVQDHTLLAKVSKADSVKFTVTQRENGEYYVTKLEKL